MEDVMKKLIIVLSFLLLASCSSPSEEPINEEPVVKEETPKPEPTPEPEPEPTPEPEDDKFYSVFTGKEVTKELRDTRPIMVMIDNQQDARPQANLSKASVVYEMRVEGSFTRYIALFERTKENFLLGPIRSARPNFVTLALQNDAIFVHHGGSTDGNAMINQYKMDDLDGMKLEGKVFFRYKDTKKVAPHNSYVEIEDVYEYQQNRGSSLERTAEGYLFNPEFTQNNGEPVKSVRFNYGGATHMTEYKYDDTTQTYAKLRNNVPVVDELSKEPVQPTNLLIQIAPSYIYNGVHRAFENVGEGKGYYLTGGQMIEIIWKKSDNHKEPLQFFTLNNEELKLNVGQTWVNVIDKVSQIDFNY